MADQEDERRIAMSLPGVSEGDDRLALSLAAIESDGFQDFLIDAWRTEVPPGAAGAFDANHSSEGR